MTEIFSSLPKFQGRHLNQHRMQRTFPRKFAFCEATVDSDRFARKSCQTKLGTSGEDSTLISETKPNLRMHSKYNKTTKQPIKSTKIITYNFIINESKYYREVFFQFACTKVLLICLIIYIIEAIGTKPSFYRFVTNYQSINQFMSVKNNC